MMRSAIVSILLLSAFLPASDAADIRIATWNLEWFYDDNTADDFSEIGRQFAAPSREEYQSRVREFARAIAKIGPDVLALQEIENAKVVQDLADRLASYHGVKYSVAFVEGKDTHTGQDVAFLVRRTIPFRTRRLPFQPRPEFKELSKNLLLECRIDGEEWKIVTLHLTTSAAERLRQAKALRRWIDGTVAGNLVVLGDFNTGVRFNETTPESDIGVIRGFLTASRADDLFDCHRALAGRSTHATGDELDRVLLSPTLAAPPGITFTTIETRRDLAIRGDRDRVRSVDYALPESEQDLSDHFPVVVTLTRTP